MAVLVLIAGAGCPLPPVDPAPLPRVRLADGATAPDNDPPPALSPGDVPSGIERFDLGLVNVTDGASSEVLIDVDDAVRSFTLLASAHAEASVVVDLVRDPDGTQVVDPDTPPDVSRQVQRLSRGFSGPFLSLNRMVPKREGGAFVVPATPEVAMVPGTWRARLRQGVVAVAADGTPSQAPLDRPLQLSVLIDTRARRERSRLQVVFHFTGAGGLTTASAASDPLVQQTVGTLVDVFGAAAVDVQVASFVDVEDGEAWRTLVLEPDLCEDGDLAHLLRALAPTPDAVDVVFVDRMQCLLRGSTLADGFAGLAASIPGDVLVEGGPHGGVAVALGVVGDDAAETARTVAHELGHLLGLFHTVEQASGADPLLFDIIEDTPNDASFSANLMSSLPQESTALSAGQAFVLGVNPWLTPVD